MSFAEKASEAIHAAGGRMTAQRQLIIDLLALSGSDGMDAELLYERARAQNDRINLATIYRTLVTLESAGLIRHQYTSPDHTRKSYTLALETYHFTCRACRRIIPFTSDLVNTLKRQLGAELGVTALHACVCVEGLCPDCQSSKKTLQAKEETE